MSRPETPRLGVYVTAFGLPALFAYPTLFWVARLDPGTAMVAAVPLGLAAVVPVWASDRLFEVVQRWQPATDPTESFSGAVFAGALSGLISSVPMRASPARPGAKTVLLSVVVGTLFWVGGFGLYLAYRSISAPSSQAEKHS